MGLTHNQKEAVNSMLGSNCPKSKFCGRQRVETAVSEIFCHFNSGIGPKPDVVKKVGYDPGQNMMSGLIYCIEDTVMHICYEN